MEEAIWSRRPILGEIMQKHGDKTLQRYSQDFLDVNPSPLLDTRKEELISIVDYLLSKRLNPEVAAGVCAQLRDCPLVSTTDHHGIIQHPFFVNANIISALPYSGSSVKTLKYLVVFSFAGVSLNNASCYARGLLFHGDINGSENLLKMPVLPDKMKRSTVYAARRFDREDLQNAHLFLAQKERVGEVVPERAAKVREFLQEYLATEPVLAAPHLSSQITKINFRLWPKLFHTAPQNGGVQSANVPDLIYLDIETIVREVFLQRLLHNPNSSLYKLLFSEDWRELALERFDGIPGAFKRSNDTGTFCFWGLDPKGHRVRLKPENGVLVSEDNLLRIPLTPEDIGQALKSKQIFPSMLLSYLTVSLYYGMKCLGGFCQVHDLTMTKKAWQQMLRDKGELEEAEALEPVQTKELGGDGMVLAYLQTKKDELVAATGIDMIINGMNTSYDGFLELSQTLTLSEAMHVLLPEMYTVLFTAEERDPALASIKPEQVMEAMGLTQKLRHEIRRIRGQID